MYQFWARALGGLGEGPVPWRLPLFGLLASKARRQSREDAYPWGGRR
jgi:hypothetical protein